MVNVGGRNYKTISSCTSTSGRGEISQLLICSAILLFLCSLASADFGTNIASHYKMNDTYTKPDNTIRWKCNDNAIDSTVACLDVNGILVGGDSCDVATTLNGRPMFHLNGSSQYVKVTIPDVWPSAISDLWTKSPNNPVIPVPSFAYFGQLAKNPNEGWYFFTGSYGTTSSDVFRFESNDCLTTWTNKTKVLAAGGAGTWDKDIHVASCFQDVNGLWNLFYRGRDDSNNLDNLRIGKATSTDGNSFTKVVIDGNNPGLFAQFGKNYDPVGCNTINGTYYMYVNGSPGHSYQNIYTSTDLQTFTAYSGNPLFPPISNNTTADGEFCAGVWKYNGDHYMMTCRDFNSPGKELYAHTLALYKDDSPLFEPNSRSFLGYTVVNDKPYDIAYLDTPSVPTNDINGTYTTAFGDNLYCIYAGNDGNNYSQNLVSSTLTNLTSRKPKLHQLFGDCLSFSFWVRFDSLTNKPLFSVGSSASDDSPVWLCKTVVSGPNTVLELYRTGGWVVSKKALSINTLYHVVVTENVDGNAVEMYVNGNKILSAANKLINSDDTFLYLGASYNNVFLDGYIGDFRIYPYKLSAEEIRDIYEYNTSDSNNLKIIDSVNDSVGVYHRGTDVTDVNLAAKSVAGKIGNALNFNGIDDYIDTNSTFRSVLRNSFSISFWCKPDDENSFSTQSLCGALTYWAGQWNKAIITLENDGKIKFVYMANGNWINAESPTAVFANGPQPWKMITVTVYENYSPWATACLYVNDDLIAMNTAFISMNNYSGRDNIYIGCNNQDGEPQQFFKGSIDNVMIFNRALWPNETAWLYNNGSGRETFYLDCNDVQDANSGLLSDLNGDCYVDYEDLIIIADYWLNTDCGSYNNCNDADFAPTDGTVNFVDFNKFAEQWMQCNDPQNPDCEVN